MAMLILKFTKKFGRNTKCDRDWINVQRENKSPRKKGETKIQRENGNKSLKKNGNKIQRKNGNKSQEK